MKRLRQALVPLLCALLLCACGASAPAEPEMPTPCEAPYPTFEYTHYASGGTAER